MLYFLIFEPSFSSLAGGTYTKVANAIKDLDYEITTDNAKGLGKGKTKVAGIGKGSAEKVGDSHDKKLSVHKLIFKLKLSLTRTYLLLSLLFLSLEDL